MKRVAAAGFVIALSLSPACRPEKPNFNKPLAAETIMDSGAQKQAKPRIAEESKLAAVPKKAELVDAGLNKPEEIVPKRESKRKGKDKIKLLESTIPDDFGFKGMELPPRERKLLFQTGD